jgi:hypothetical protein
MCFVSQCTMIVQLPSLVVLTLALHKIPAQNRFAASIAASKYRRRPQLYSFFLDLTGPPRPRVTRPARPDSTQQKFRAAPYIQLYKLLDSKFYATLVLKQILKKLLT